MPEPDYNTSAVSSAPTSSPSPQSRPSGLGSRSGRNMDADMYAGSSYAPTSGAGTASAKQTFSSKATSTGGFTGAASNKSDDGPGYGQPYNPAATLYSNTATALTNAGVNLTPPTQASYNPMNLYSSQSMTEISTEINDYLRGTAIDAAMREALGIPEVYQGVPTQEEPDPIVDTDVLRDALQPEPITVEELPEDRMFVGMDGSDMFEEEVTVKAGDTLTAIAEANNLPVQDVIDANPQIANPDMIRPGEKVNLTKRLDTKGETPARELPEVLSIPEAAAYMGKERATLIMKGIDKLFGLVPPKTDIEKKAKSELEYFLDAQPESSLPDFFKYVPDKVQLAEYMKGRAERKKAAGTMNFAEGDVDTSNLQFVDIEDEPGAAGLMTRPRARPEGLDAPNKKEQAKAVQKYLGITVDGIWGKGSTRKLAGWQYQNGVPVSGEIDEATIKAMKDPTTEDPRKPKVLTSVLNSAGDAPVLSKVKAWAKDNIEDPTRAAAFVATVEAETGGRDLEENGYLYSRAKRGNRTPAELASKLAKGNTARSDAFKALAQDPQWINGDDATKNDMIFDIYYDDQYRSPDYRLGNTQQGDGSLFKGRGLIQLTGRKNYKDVGDLIGVDLVANPELVNDPKYAASAAMAYLSLPGKDFFSGNMTRDYLKDVVGHSGGSREARRRWNRATMLEKEMYP